jgi:adenosylhomocysteine nucleosidase
LSAPAATCVLFALAREAMFFGCRGRERIPKAPCPAWRAGQLLVMVTGMGAKAARRAADWALALPCPPRRLIAAGFAGALQPGVPAGSVVVATEVIDGQGGRWPAPWPTSADAWARGRVLTWPRLVCTAAEKRSLGTAHDAVAVDMESAAVARACAERGVEFGCVRAVSDDVEAALSPALVRLLSGGRVAPGRVALALLRRPALGCELFRLARDTRRAARNLAAALGSLCQWPGQAGGHTTEGGRTVGG